MMRNLKKISRNELKNVIGGKRMEPGRFCCCNSSGCSTKVYGDSTDLYCADAGTSLQKC